MCELNFVIFMFLRQSRFVAYAGLDLTTLLPQKSLNSETPSSSHKTHPAPTNYSLFTPHTRDQSRSTVQAGTLCDGKWARRGDG
jgi:hypothetical protein